MRISDWSSDVCSSDLVAIMRGLFRDRLGIFVDRQVLVVEQQQVHVVVEHDNSLLHVVERGLQQRRLLLDQPLAFLQKSEEHTSELQSLMRISYAVFCLKKKT